MIEKTGTTLYPTPAVNGSMTADDKTLLEVAGQFEALMLSSMMKSMRATLSGDSLTGSTQQDMYQEMMDKELVESIVSGEGLGLKQLLVQQLSKVTTVGDTFQAQTPSTTSENESPQITAKTQPTLNESTASFELMSRLRVTLGENSSFSGGSTERSW